MSDNTKMILNLRTKDVIGFKEGTAINTGVSTANMSRRTSIPDMGLNLYSSVI